MSASFGDPVPLVLMSAVRKGGILIQVTEPPGDSEAVKIGSGRYASVTRRETDPAKLLPYDPRVNVVQLECGVPWSYCTGEPVKACGMDEPL
jgi:hypothetical protein